MPSSITLLFGPTGSGKSAYAEEAVKRTGGTIINADSVQLYGLLPILTALPEPEPYHALYGVLSPEQRFSVGDWLSAVQEVLVKTPGPHWVVGGTGFYLKALQEGLSPIPPVPEEVRACVQELFHQEGREGLIRELSGEIPKDTQRLLRAVEVKWATGKLLSYWQSLPKEGGLGKRAHFVRLMPHPQEHYAFLRLRCQKMIEKGALEEVREAENILRSLDLSHPLRKACGVETFLSFLEGQLSWAQAEEAFYIQTRQYAKRQLTWGRWQ